jgi:hypothetical protein
MMNHSAIANGGHEAHGHDSAASCTAANEADEVYSCSDGVS